ncbi:MAG: lipoyl(octanoyl) transferase LipB [Gammaproteobacteria bacterium]|nr:lipoyl(octanoyl) transferase LipB [Gammaproteobacteria bacterium]
MKARLDLIVRKLGIQPYESVWQDMKDLTQSRGDLSPDEYWVLEHPSVFTLGLSKQPSMVIGNEDIPVIKTDRGGQITYHGPGQIIGYFLWDIRRLGLDVHQFVRLVEQCMLDTLGYFDIVASRWDGNPGVYVKGKKIGSLGIRLKHGCSYHGLSLNVEMDTEPFRMIDPCGITGLQVTQIADFVQDVSVAEVEETLIRTTQELYATQLDRLAEKHEP